MQIFGRNFNISGQPTPIKPQVVFRNPFTTLNGALLNRGAPASNGIMNH